MPSLTPLPPLHWDVFCRVVDNFGDIGVCWRLACDLAARGQTVRLWLDDASALAWMAPDGCAGVEVVPWQQPMPELEPGDVVVEAFGCDPPPAFVSRMARRSPAPTWINLEYLSAEAYVERSHRLPSPQLGGPGAGLTKWFFYPGFTADTGGLIRERDLQERRQAFDADAWLAAQAIAPRPDERTVSLFCYRDAPLAALIDTLAETPTLLLATAGIATIEVGRLLGPTLERGALRASMLPQLTQRDYDHLLWSCDLNFVRGEDSFVRAQWAGRPFVWQAYPQLDGAHMTKLDAFLDRMMAGADPATTAALRDIHSAWNGGITARPIALPDLARWRAACVEWRARLLAQADLTTQLLGFVGGSR